MEQLKLGKYQHYKGKYYEVIEVARDSETLEEIIIYRALYYSEEFGNNALWVRTLSSFRETIIVDGKSIPRFKLVD